MNKVILLGRLTKDPDVKTTESGLTIANFSLAVNRKFVKEGEERQADFILCKAFGRTAEFIAKYIAKGQQVAITGRIQTGSYMKDDQKVFTTDVIIEDVYFADSKKSGTGTNDADNLTPGTFPSEDDDTLPF